MFTFATDYFIMVTVASVGTIQFAAASAGLRGLLFLRSKNWAQALGIVLILAGLGLFFATEDRNINDYEGGLDANIQSLLFFLGTVSGFGVTVVGSSLLNIRMTGGEEQPEGGLDALRHTNFAMAIRRNLKYWGRNWRTQTKRYFSG
ncbi:MAG: hypothetical protein O3A47_05190 [Chloroflexi bacterium]|nr:hypothetical protein [Chloroflexota bacterium]